MNNSPTMTKMPSFAQVVASLCESPMLENRAARTSFCRADPGLNTTAVKERLMSLTLNTPGIRLAQAGGAR